MRTSPLTNLLDQLDTRVHSFTTSAIRDHGEEFRDHPIQFFRTAPLDINVRGNSWVVSYDQEEQQTERMTIGQYGERETNANLRITVALPGTAVKDTSTQEVKSGDNWGDRQLTTRESERRHQQQISRAVAENIAEKFDDIKELGMQVTAYNVVVNSPQIINQKLVLYPMTVNIAWRFWWDHKPDA